MAETNRPKTIFEQILEGEQVNNEILAGLATEMELIKEQQKMILLALYPPEADTEPTASGSDTI